MGGNLNTNLKKIEKKTIKKKIINFFKKIIKKEQRPSVAGPGKLSQPP